MSSLTIKKIAEIAAVSVSTVSKVLNNKSDVSDVTREKVLEVIREQGYQRRVSAVNGRVVGVFLPFNHGVRLSNPYTSAVIFGATDYLFQQDYRIELISMSTIPRTRMEFLRYCTQSNIQAALFVLSRLEDRFIGDLGELLPVVATGNSFAGTSVTTVCYDAYNAGRVAVSHLIDLGHRHVGFLCEDQVHRDQVLRYKAFHEALLDINPEYTPPVLLNTVSHDKADIRHFLEHTMKASPSPSAFVVSNDMVATCVLEQLDVLGIDVPGMISVIGFDDLPFSRHLKPPLTTVSQPTYEIGRIAGEEINLQLSGDFGNRGREIVLKGQLIMRSSVAAFRE